MRKRLLVITLAAFVAQQSYGFGLGDLKKVVDKSYKCKAGDQGCKNREHLKAVAKVAAVAVVATVITKMIIKQRATRLAKEDQVAEDYKAQQGNLPPEPVATQYQTTALPGAVVEPGKEVVIQSDIVVVPGAKQKQALIEERIAIYDNEDNTKELKTLTKAVNASNKRAGHYQNEFTFTLPEGIPQGVYPIKTELLLNGKVVDTNANDLQLVMEVNNLGQWQLLALND